MPSRPSPVALSLPAHAQSGKGYAELARRAPVNAPKGQIEVLEFFLRLHPLHAFQSPSWTPGSQDPAQGRERAPGARGLPEQFRAAAKIYYTLEAMGKVDGAACRRYSRPCRSTERKAPGQTRRAVLPGPPSRAWIAKFESTWLFGVATQLRRAVQMQDAYKVEGTPALGIGGRYYTDGSMAGGFDHMVKIANQLIEQVRKRLRQR